MGGRALFSGRALRWGLIVGIGAQVLSGIWFWGLTRQVLDGSDAPLEAVVTLNVFYTPIFLNLWVLTCALGGFVARKRGLIAGLVLALTYPLVLAVAAILAGSPWPGLLGPFAVWLPFQPPVWIVVGVIAAGIAGVVGWVITAPILWLVGRIRGPGSAAPEIDPGAA